MPTKSENERREGTRRVGTYVYAIVKGEVELEPDARGLGDPPGELQLVRKGDIAAMVSEIDADSRLGSPEELQLHERLLDATAAANVPVLPMRFGAVMSGREAVADELLAKHHDLFSDALEELRGRAQYLLHGRYVEDAVLREALSENDDAERLRERIRETSEEESQDLRIELGEIVNQVIEAKRQADSARAAELLAPHTVASTIRPPSHELDAVRIAVLAELDAEQDIEEAAETLAREWEGRVEVRLSGPLAPYDFVAQSKPES